ncbi:MAG: alpha/beta hydrolase [Pseudomonadota bacterium]
MADIEFKGRRIAYDVAEAKLPWAEPAPAIVFVHGIGADREIWSGWRQVLAGHYRTIALDMPGHGQSFRPGADLDWDIHDLANMVVAVAKDAGADRYILIGESMGGTTCLVAAADNPDVAAIGTCSTAHIGGTLGHVQGWRNVMSEQGLEAWSNDMIAKRFTSWQTSDEQRDWFYKAQMASDGETILQLADILVGLNFTDRLTEITCPVLLMHPDSSPFIPLDIPVQLKDGLPDAEMMVIPGARHGIALSHAHQCAGAIADFIRRREIA